MASALAEVEDSQTEKELGKKEDAPKEGSAKFREQYTVFEDYKTDIEEQNIAIFGFHRGAAKYLYDEYFIQNETDQRSPSSEASESQDGKTDQRSHSSAATKVDVVSKTIVVNDKSVKISYCLEQTGSGNFKRSLYKMLKRNPKGFTSYILVYDPSYGRFSSNDTEFIEMFKAALGDSAVFRHTSLVFFKIDKMLSQQVNTVREFLGIPGNFLAKDIADRINMRVIGLSTLDFTGFDKHFQRDELLAISGSTNGCYFPRIWYNLRKPRYKLNNLSCR